VLKPVLLEEAYTMFGKEISTIVQCGREISEEELERQFGEIFK
jgi:uncharacterized protein YfbU (UPF0304 family)